MSNGGFLELSTEIPWHGPRMRATQVTLAPYFKMIVIARLMRATIFFLSPNWVARILRAGR
jgi:hypothetical protein